MHGQEPGSLVKDLYRVSKWFDPSLSGGAIRSRVRDLPRVTIRWRIFAKFDPPLVVSAKGGVLVTPEGRLALDVLKPGDTPHSLALELSTDRRLLELYRELVQRRALDVIADLEGHGKKMYVLSAGAVLLLVRHGALTRDTGLRLYADDGDLARRLVEPLARFAAVVYGEPPQAYKTTFDGYPYTRARERLGHAIERDPPKGKPARFWVAHRDEALDTVAREMVSRRGLSSERAVRAVDALLDGYDELADELGGRRLPRSRSVPREGFRRDMRRRFARYAGAK
jgi:hypothetical protein